MGNNMSVNLNHFDSKIEDIKNNYNARFRQGESYSKEIVAANMNALSATHQAEIANLAGSEKMINAHTYIAGASNHSPLLNLVSDFNKFFTQGANSPSKDVPSR